MIALALLATACGSNTISSPSKITAPAAESVSCTAPVIQSIDVDMAGPQLRIRVQSTTPFIVEVERFDNSHTWVPWSAINTNDLPPLMVDGKAAIPQLIAIDVWFDHQYRIRIKGCSDWSSWMEKRVGPANPCGSCTSAPVPVPSAPSAPFAASVCTAGIFVTGITEQLAINVPAGTYRVDVETKDAAHAPGYQPDQTQEVVTVRGIGTTEDIPETATSHVTAFTAAIPTLTEVVIEGGRDSVHGVCVSFSRE